VTCVLIDTHSGNLHSAHKAFERMAAETGAGPVTLSSDPEVIARADRLVLPGDGAFPACRREMAAMDGLEEALMEAVRDRAVPLMGICVGMQMLATRGLEFEEVAGLDLIAGTVARIVPDDPALKVPHMGWNDLRLMGDHPVLNGVGSGDHAYFVHSYAMEVDDPADLLATADYGGQVTAIVGRGTVVGTQFHPEKSQATGLRIIANFLGWRP
jgi:glutamine amidotransferase